MRIGSWVFALAIALVAASPLPAHADRQCYGPFTLSRSGAATPVPTPAATPTVYPTVTPVPVRQTHTNHQFFVSWTEDGQNLDAAPWVVFKGTGADGITTNILTVKAASGGVIPGPTPTPDTRYEVACPHCPVAENEGRRLSVADMPLTSIFAELHGCVNCTVLVSWCSSD